VNVRGTARLIALFALSASACTGARGETSPSASHTSADPVTVRVAYFDDLTLDEPYQHELPALQGFRLALSRAVEADTVPVDVEVVELDTQGDAAKAIELAQEVAGDPSYIAAVAAPFWSQPDEVGEMLDRAGLLTFGLSGLGAPSDEWGGRLRLVPIQALQVEAVTAYLRRVEPGGVCVARDATPYGASFAAELAEALGRLRSGSVLVAQDESEIVEIVESVQGSGCTFVAWAGYGTAASALRIGLTDAGLESVPLIGSDAMKTEGYLGDAGGAGEGTIVSCGCVDLTTSTELAAQVFIHDYQSEYGTAPGVFSAEGLDAGNLLLDALRSGPPTRGAVRAAATSLGSFEGLARTYVFAGGELEGSTIALFEDRGQRWAPLVRRGP
jgi:branched-chain amino acid transport system substrate-binding protein